MKLVLVHGFLGNAMNWLPIVKRLDAALLDGRLKSKDWQFQCVDLLGHGKKANLSSLPEMKLADVAQDLMNEIGPEPFVGLGHSFGIRPLLDLYELFQKKVALKSLIVEDSSPAISENGFSDLQKIFKELPQQYESRKLAKEAFQKIWGMESKMPNFLLTNIVEIGNHFRWRFNVDQMWNLLEDSRRNPLWSAWEQFEGRVDMILGAQSSFVPQARVDECVARRLPRPTYVHRIPQSGHWVHSEQPEAFTNELIKMLNLV